MAKRGTGSGDLVTHCNSARVRVVGSGNLKAALTDSVGNGQFLAEGTMSEDTGKGVTHLGNFKGERISYEIYVELINEWFVVSNMYAYVKKTAASYPQP